MKHKLVRLRLGWMNSGGTRQPAGKWRQALLATATSYDILRNTTPDPNGATFLHNVPAAEALVFSRTASATTYHYDDSTVVGRLSYYYWVRALSGSGVSALSYVGMGYAELGSAGGLPVPADYDGDGRADPAVYHPDTGLWELFPSTQGYQLIWGFFGGPAYQPVTE